MRHAQWIVPAGIVLSVCAFVMEGSGPDDRTITDPASVVSAPNPGAHAIPIEDLFFTRSVATGAWSPDGKQVLLTTDISGRDNLWKVPAGGGWPIQLTQSEDRQMGVWSPDGKSVLFQQDFGGNEVWDIMTVPSDGGPVVNLTNTPDIREQDPRWSPDGTTIAIGYKPKSGTVYDVALLDWSTHKVTKLTHEQTNHSWSSVAWSRDGATLYATRTDASFTDADVYAIDVRTGATTDLTTHEGRSLNIASSLSPDGTRLLLTSNQKGGYNNVALLDVATKQLTWATNDKWESTAGDFSPDGSRFTYVVNADGRADAYLADVATLHAEQIPLPAGMNGFVGNPTAFSPDGSRLLMSHESSVQAADVWVYDLRDHNARQLTFSAIASLSGAPLPPSTIVHYKSFDGKIISALMWMPFNLKRDGSAPALVLPHGGPSGQTTDSWNPDVTALVSRGYICIAPNVRGSSGYGMDFQRANYKDLGGGDLQDEVYAVRFLTATGYADPKRIGITGGSYGGFMTLMAVGRTPDIWAAAVEEYGIIDWRTMLQHSDPELQQYEKTLLGDPVADRQVYATTSPITYLHHVRAPLLVLQGDNDPRVPKEEAQQVVALLKTDARVVDAHYYPNEGHGFSKREHRLDAIRRTVEWFDKYLKKGR